MEGKEGEEMAFLFGREITNFFEVETEVILANVPGC